TSAKGSEGGGVGRGLYGAAARGRMRGPMAATSDRWGKHLLRRFLEGSDHVQTQRGVGADSGGAVGGRYAGRRADKGRGRRQTAVAALAARRRRQEGQATATTDRPALGGGRVREGPEGGRRTDCAAPEGPGCRPLASRGCQLAGQSVADRPSTG